MPPRDGGDAPSTPPRRSRLTEARGYHPRARTVGEPRPRLYVVPDDPAVTTVAPAKAAAPRRAPTRTGATTATMSETPTVAPRQRARSSTVESRPVRVTRQVARRPAVPSVPPPLADQQRRLRLAGAIILLLFVIVGGRLVEIQFTDAGRWRTEGLDQRSFTIPLLAPRGDILDRNGQLLAGSVETRLVYADPTEIADPQDAAAKLVGVLGVPASTLLEKLRPHPNENGAPSRFEYLAHGVPVEVGDRVDALGIKGVVVERDESRVVPGHDLAANLIGFTGDVDMRGLAGLEASYNDVLRGENGSRTYETGQREATVNLDREIPSGQTVTTPAKPGRSLRLTIDRDLQFEVQRILGEQATKAKADMAAAVVLDVRTGEILAQASYPFYNASTPFDYPADYWRDNASSYVVEPGSVHKGIVFAACLQEGVITPDTVIDVPASIKKGDVKVEDTHSHSGHPMLTMPGILAWSSNVGTVELADQLGAQKLYEYQRAFGLGAATDLGLPGEAPGLVQPPENWSASSYGSIPIGHGVSVTPLQMAAVYATIANGGKWVQPHVVKSIINADQTESPIGLQAPRQVISADNAAALDHLLEAVVTAPDATGRSAHVDNYRVAGKTGTGRVILNGKVVPGEVASFVGMAPADAPRYVIAVFAHTPAGNGGPTTGPAFSKMMDYTLRYYRVPPTGTPEPQFKIYP
jgi:cell division protein FtsI (penicillin-binding protein 3)